MGGDGNESGLPTELLLGYLRRLGFEAPPHPGPDTLRRLHAAHVQRVPFENLSVRAGEEVLLEPEALVAKIVRQGRGGFCYELNGAFAALLGTLGFEVALLAARVFQGEALGPPYDHLCLAVDLDERWLVDVGFGDCFRLPLRLDDRGDQTDGIGLFRLAPVPGGSDELDLLHDGTARYRFSLTRRALSEFAETCRYHQTSPESPFTRLTMCSLATPVGRISIIDSTLIVTEGDARTETILNEADVAAAYRDRFGIDLSRLASAPT